MRIVSSIGAIGYRSLCRCLEGNDKGYSNNIESDNFLQFLNKYRGQLKKGCGKS